MKTVTYENEIPGGFYPHADVEVSVQGAITSVKAGASFLTLDSGIGGYTLQNTDSYVEVTGSGQLFLSLPDTNTCYLGQKFTVGLNMTDGVDYSSAFCVISSNDGTKFNMLNYRKAEATFYCVSIGDNSATGWRTSHVIDYVASVSIENPAGTFTGGSVITWDVVEQNTTHPATGDTFFDIANNAIRILEEGQHEFHVMFHTNPGNNKIGLLLSRNGDKTAVSYHWDNPNSEPMTIRVDYLAFCQVGELWDVRVWGSDLTALTGEKWYYKFQCRRIKT